MSDTASAVGATTELRLLEPWEHDFGPTPVGSSSEAEAFTVTNNTDTPLKIEEVKLAGPNPEDFHIETEASDCEPGMTLAPGEKCHVFVHCQPTIGGTREALLEVYTGAEPARALLKCEGVPFGIEIDPPSYEFGPKQREETFTFENSSDKVVTIQGVELSGDKEEFMLKRGTYKSGIELAPKQACTLLVVYSPHKTRLARAQLKLNIEPTPGPGQVQATLLGKP